MTPHDPAHDLLALPKHGSGIGLHRVLRVLDGLDPTWLGGLDAIKITGSNGKGSVSAMVAANLGALGLRVGLHTSPHLERFHERIVVQGQPIGEAELRESHAWFEGIRAECLRDHPDDDFGAFEAITSVAMHHFCRARVDTVVAEAGIGGRYDATRAIPGRVCGLVSVDLEHTALLGGTAEMIAYDKADLCPPGGTLMVGPLPDGLPRRLAAYCRLRGVSLERSDARARAEVVSESLAGTTVCLQIDALRIDDLHIPSPGAHQVDNAVLAICMATTWLQRHRPGLAPSTIVAAIHEAFSGLRLPGRLELVHGDPPVIIDVGHTPAAVRSTVAALTRILGQTKVVLVVGVSEDRSAEDLLLPLMPLAEHVICTRAHHRGGDPTRIEAVLRRSASVSYSLAPTIDHAMHEALERARSTGLTVLVAGGLFLAMEAAAVLRGEDPRALRFF